MCVRVRSVCAICSPWSELVQYEIMSPHTHTTPQGSEYRYSTHITRGAYSSISMWITPAGCAHPNDATRINISIWQGCLVTRGSPQQHLRTYEDRHIYPAKARNGKHSCWDWLWGFRTLMNAMLSASCCVCFMLLCSHVSCTQHDLTCYASFVSWTQHAVYVMLLRRLLFTFRSILTCGRFGRLNQYHA